MNTPIVHVFDLETSAFNTKAKGRSLDLLQEFLEVSADLVLLQRHELFVAHKQSQLLQIYATGGIFHEGDQGWVKPSDGMVRWEAAKPYQELSTWTGAKAPAADTAKYIESKWAADQGLVDEALLRGIAYEHQRVEQFYWGLETSIARSPGQAVVLVGHHSAGFDLWRLEYATYQHESLAHRRGWLADQVRRGHLQLRDTNLEVKQAALAFAQQDPDFGTRHFVNREGIPAQTLAEAEFVKGSALQNVANALGVPKGRAHNAFYDAGRTEGAAQVLTRGLTPDELRRIYPERLPRRTATRLAPALEKPLAAEAGFLAAHGKTVAGYSALGVAALGVAYWLAHGTREDRQTQVTGLPEGGLAAQVRHKMTSFGSGYRGVNAQPNPYQLESEQAYSPTLRVLGAGVVGGVGYFAHHEMLKGVPGYAQKLHKYAKLFEERSPAHIGRTFGLSERISAYLPETVTYTHAQLFNDDGSLNFVGETLQRQFEDRLDVLREVTPDNPLVFTRKGWEGHSHIPLTSHGDYARRGIATMHTTAGGRLAGTASRLDRKIVDQRLESSTSPSFFTRIKENYRKARSWQQVNNKLPASLKELPYQPFHTNLAPRVTGALEEPFQRAGAVSRDLWSRLRVELLEAFERPQRLFAELGLGLKRGTWNSTSSLVGGMLVKRVLPIVAGATALKYLDYELGHKPSNALIDLPLKANVLRADLTDMVPGARGVTAFYADTVPGSQYGPLALPAAGAFAGGIYHYQKVLRGVKEFAGPEGEKARKAASRVFPRLEGGLRPNLRAIGKKLTSVEGMRDLWTKLGAPGKGVAIGLGLMLPFVPGMLGSRESGAELRDIYSGQEPVPVRSGRWWSLGSTAYEGGRIKAWRPHKSVLLKSRAETVAVYGSEKEYWKHNPILHPLRWLRDPYYLERCMVDGTPIVTPDGRLVPIEQMLPGEQVVTQTGRSSVVEAHWTETISEEVVRITSALYSSYPLTSTPEHRYLAVRTEPCVARKSRPGSFCVPDKTWVRCASCSQVLYRQYQREWLRADEIKQGDYLAIPRPELPGCLSEIQLPQPRPYQNGVSWTTGRQVPLPPTVKADERLFSLIGWYLAEGHTASRSVVFTLADDEQKYAGEIVAHVQDVFGLHCTITEIPEKHTIKVTVSHSRLAAWFRKHFGHGAANKRIGKQFLQGKKKVLRALVVAFFHGDGTYKGGPVSVSANGISEQLIHQVKHILLGLGYVPS
ncbi:hypothetical protein D4R30_00930, partial [archaeon]